MQRNVTITSPSSVDPLLARSTLNLAEPSLKMAALSNADDNARLWSAASSSTVDNPSLLVALRVTTRMDPTGTERKVLDGRLDPHKAAPFGLVMAA